MGMVVILFKGVEPFEYTVNIPSTEICENWLSNSREEDV